MQTRVAVMSIILEDNAHAEEINDILHLYGRYIIGRMGLPYRQKNINIICVAVDAPQDVISAMVESSGACAAPTLKRRIPISRAQSRKSKRSDPKMTNGK